MASKAGADGGGEPQDRRVCVLGGGGGEWLEKCGAC